MSERNRLRTVMALFFLSVYFFTTGSAPALQRKEGTPKAEFQQQARASMKDDKKKESPFACNATGLNKEQRQRWTSLLKRLNDSKQEVRELADGYAFRFAAEPSTVQELAEFITYERICCPFFDLEVAVEREGGPAWLRLRGREGVKDFIRDEFGIQ